MCNMISLMTRCFMTPETWFSFLKINFWKSFRNIVATELLYLKSRTYEFWFRARNVTFNAMSNIKNIFTNSRNVRKVPWFHHSFRTWSSIVLQELPWPQIRTKRLRIRWWCWLPFHGFRLTISKVIVQVWFISHYLNETFTNIAALTVWKIKWNQSNYIVLLRGPFLISLVSGQWI